jgi:hypothetical protein
VLLTTIPAAGTPGLTVQADGRAVEAVAETPDSTPQTRNGHIPPETLTAAFAEAKSLAALDMGEPEDGGDSTLLDFLGASPDQDVHLVVYGSGATEGLSDEEKTNRAHFADLCKTLTDAFVPN